MLEERAGGVLERRQKAQAGLFHLLELRLVAQKSAGLAQRFDALLGRSGHVFLRFIDGGAVDFVGPLRRQQIFRFRAGKGDSRMPAPESGRAIVADGGDTGSIEREQRILDLLPMPQEPRDEAPGADVEELRRVIVACSYDAPSVQIGDCLM